MNSLFEASSTFPSEKKEERIYYWFRSDRATPLISYEQLIGGYNTLTPQQRSVAEQKSRQLLTAEELQQLKRYIEETKGLEVVSKEIPIPIDPAKLQQRSPHEKLELWKEEGYTLPFRIEAYIRHEPVTMPEDIDTGVSG